jgi:hypothetical protein
VRCGALCVVRLLCTRNKVGRIIGGTCIVNTQAYLFLFIVSTTTQSEE